MKTIIQSLTAVLALAFAAGAFAQIMPEMPDPVPLPVAAVETITHSVAVVGADAVGDAIAATTEDELAAETGEDDAADATQ